MSLVTYQSLQRESESLLQQVALCVKQRELELRIENNKARLSAARNDRNGKLVASIRLENAELSSREPTLSEADCRTLPGRLQELEDRLLEHSLSCALDEVNAVATMQGSVRQALVTLAGPMKGKLLPNLLHIKYCADYHSQFL
jgi:hypothetical protein